MTDFLEFEKYIFDVKSDEWKDSKHAFFKFDISKLEKAVSEINRFFPYELVEFYKQIGYGFVCNNTSSVTSRIMDPQSISDFLLGRGYYKHFDQRERFFANNMFPFFEVSELSILTFDLSQINQKNQCPVYYYNKKIADSLFQFLKKSEVQTDYYFFESDI